MADQRGRAFLGAVKDGRLKEVQQMLDAGGVDVNDVYSTQNGWNALMWAAYSGHVDIARVLIKQGWASVDIVRNRTTFMVPRGTPVNIQASDGHTALMLAASKGRTAAVLLLLQHGASVESTDYEQRTALMLAAANGFKDVVSLLKYGAFVDGLATDSKTALMLSAERGHEEIVCMLLDATATIDLLAHDSTAFELAAANGHENVMRTLLHYGATIRQDGTPLIHGARNGHEGVVRLLLKHVSPTLTSFGFGLALGYAARNGHEKVVRVLLETVHLSYYDIEDAAECAGANGHFQVAHMILDGLIYRTINVSAPYPSGYETTALICAVFTSSKATVEKILDQGVPVDIRGAIKKTAIMCATEMNCEDIVQSLLNHEFAAGNIEALAYATANALERIVHLLLGSKHTARSLLAGSGEQQDNCDTFEAAARRGIAKEIFQLNENPASTSALKLGNCDSKRMEDNRKTIIHDILPCNTTPLIERSSNP